MLKMVDGTGIIGVDMVCPLGGAVSPPQPPNYDKVEVEGVGSLMLPNSLKAPLERVELLGNSVQGENPAPENPQEIKSAGKRNEGTQKYEIDVKVTGKNLFNAEKAKDANNWTSSAILLSYKEFSIYVGKGNPVNISYLENLETGLGFYANIARSKNDYTMYWLYHSDSEINITKNKNFIAMNDYIVLRVDAGSVPKFFEYIKTLQIEIGSKQTPYEPYTEQTLTLTSDRPLTKWDKLVEQGGEYGWLYQSASDTDAKPSRVDLFPNGFSLFKDFGNGVYVYKVTNIKKAIGFQTSLCKQFKNKDGSYSTGDLFCYSDQPSMQMQYFVTDIPTLEEFKTWMETNPLTMAYKTTQTEFVSLSESEQTQLRNLHSYNGTTNITVDSGEVPCGIKLTYRKEI